MNSVADHSGEKLEGSSAAFEEGSVLAKTTQIMAKLRRLRTLAEQYYRAGQDMDHLALVEHYADMMESSEYHNFLAEYDRTEPGSLWKPVRELAMSVASDYLSENVDHAAVRDFVNGDTYTKLAMARLGAEQCWLIATKDDQRLLSMLVALISMIDELAGWGPTFDYQLENLQSQAEEAGVDFGRAVQEVAGISSGICRTGRNGTSIREFLLTFGQKADPPEDDG